MMDPFMGDISDSEFPMLILMLAFDDSFIVSHELAFQRTTR